MDKKWEDVDFPADGSSIQWTQFGYQDSGPGAPKADMKWLRPSETDYAEDGPISFFGKAGKPLPQGVAQ